MRPSPTTLVALGALAGRALADPTWPSSVDELEEIMCQLTSFGARRFADTVSPCSNEASGPGRLNAAEWLRAAFHDMSTANAYFKMGGLDASLQYELANTENTGPGHRTTLDFMSRYLSPRSGLADLAAGVYASVRSCGGPVVPVRAGKKDATAKGPTGVPQPQNPVPVFRQQFERMGFTAEEMIQLTACGHTLGGVHRDEFPDLTPPGAKDGQAPSDSTVALFDNKVVIEYLSDTTSNPLVVGASVKAKRNSDFKVFSSDGNKTVRALADPAAFRAACQRVLAKMIDVVPEGVALTDPVVPYAVKSVNHQLTLTNGGRALAWTGYIRVRTTGLPADGIGSITVDYRDRRGSADCGSRPCTLASTVQGVGRGFDDTFSFFPVEATIPAESGISSFTVTVHHANGTSRLYDNNGAAYPLRDDVVFQAPQSCVRGSTGALRVAAAVRNDVGGRAAPRATVWYKMPRANRPVPQLKRESVALVKGRCVGGYTLFAADYAVPGGLAYEAHVDVTADGQTDGFKSLAGVGGTGGICAEFVGGAPCDAAAPTATHGTLVHKADNTTATAAPTAPPATTTAAADTGWRRAGPRATAPAPWRASRLPTTR